MKKGVYITIYIILILIILGIVAYDYFPDQALESHTILRAGIFFVGLVISIIRSATGSDESVANKKAAYTKAYPQFIGSAFSHSPKLEKDFYHAVDDYNRNRPFAGIKKLNALRPQCQTSDDIYATTVFQALCYDAAQMYDHAIESYHAAIQLRPNSTLISNMGLCHGATGNLEEAKNCYLEAIQLDARNEFPYNNLAQQYLRSGDYTNAADYAKQALAVNPHMPQALNVMTVCSYINGDMDAYENYYRQAVSNGSNGKAIKNFIKSLDTNID